MFKRFLLTITALSLMFCLLSCGYKTDNNSNNLKQELEKLLENSDKDQIIEKADRENLGYQFDGETVFKEDNYIGN